MLTGYTKMVTILNIMPVMTALCSKQECVSEQSDKAIGVTVDCFVKTKEEFSFRFIQLQLDGSLKQQEKNSTNN